MPPTSEWWARTTVNPANPRGIGLYIFNPDRYGSPPNDPSNPLLHVNNNQSNEILAQIAWMIKSNHANSPLRQRYPVRTIVMGGTSASSGFVRNYLGAVNNETFRTPDGGPVIDGFLVTATLGGAPVQMTDVPTIHRQVAVQEVQLFDIGVAVRRVVCPWRQPHEKGYTIPLRVDRKHAARNAGRQACPVDVARLWRGRKRRQLLPRRPDDHDGPVDPAADDAVRIRGDVAPLRAARGQLGSRPAVVQLPAVSDVVERIDVGVAVAVARHAQEAHPEAEPALGDGHVVQPGHEVVRGLGIVGPRDLVDGDGHRHGAPGSRDRVRELVTHLDRHRGRDGRARLRMLLGSDYGVAPQSSTDLSVLLLGEAVGLWRGRRRRTLREQ